METIKYEIENSIALITMDDGKANAMNPVFFENFDNALKRSIEDDAKVLIIAGRPGFFSGGLDLKMLSKTTPDELGGFLRMFANTLMKVFSLPIPTIAACTGHAIAGGAMLSFACDLRFAIDAPLRIHMNEVETGIAPLPSWMLLIGRFAIPVEYITEALLHARLYTPKEAYERKIVTGLVDEGNDIVAFAKKKAEELLKLNSKTYAVSKARMRQAEIETVNDSIETEIAQIVNND